MQEKLLSYLRCPVSRQKLEMIVIDRIIKTYTDETIDEINSAILYSPNGFVFPVIKGIPRMQVESILCFDDFWLANFPDYKERKNKLLAEYADILNRCYKKNKATRQSFSFEWSILKRDGAEKVWHDDVTQLKNQVLKEIDEINLEGKRVVDIGCGHGLSSVSMANAGAKVIGIDLSYSIEEAYEQLLNSNVFFVQADLQFPPLENNDFDIVYSSGVIHHSNNTELSFNIIQNLVKKQGKVSIWLYHRTKSILYNLALAARKVTIHIPPRIQFWIYMFTLMPVYFIILNSKGKKLNWREVMIDLLDSFTPYHRFEHSPVEATCWYAKMGFGDIKITDQNFFGFSITGTKNE